MTTETTTPPALGAGDVPITLAGEARVLKPSLRAFQTLSRQYGGIMPLVRRIEDLDIDAVISVVTAGLNTLPKDVPAVSEMVYTTGLGSDRVVGLGPTCVVFLLNLANGGRPYKSGTEGGDSQDPPK